MYFAAENSSGYSCKVRITPESENLSLGFHDLFVEDQSVRSKYGVDVIYLVKGDVKETGVVSLQHFTYNAWLVSDCRKLGGKWDENAKAWIFSSIVSDRVDELDVEYNAKIVNVEITAKKDLSKGRGSIDFCGYSIARATGRDSGAKLSTGVYEISGKIGSGGSQKSWHTTIANGSTFRLKASDTHIMNQEDWTVVILAD